MLRYDEKAKRVTEHRELGDTTLRIVAWAQDADGEVYALDFIDGSLYQLDPRPARAEGSTRIPAEAERDRPVRRRKTLKPATGLIPYSVNAELWSDGASKERFIAIPGDGKIEYETVTYPQPAPGSRARLAVPRRHGAREDVLRSRPNPARSGGWRRGCSSSSASPGPRSTATRSGAATPTSGTTSRPTRSWPTRRASTASTPSKSAAGERKQTWHFPSRAECTLCHTVTAKYALGVNTAQMNRDHDYGGVVANQLATLEHIGVFDASFPSRPKDLAKLADYRDRNASLDARARAYLHANCSHCHRKWGGGNAEFQLLSTLPVDELGIVNTKPGQGAFDLKDPRILVPGDPERSMLYHRMTRTGLGRMPHIASNVVDEEGVKLIGEWIKAMK